MAQSRLQGKVALVTGAARRIGRAIAVSLAREGVSCLVHYRHSCQEAETLCAELSTLGVRAWPLQADFAKPEEYETLISRAQDLAGSLDYLINSASIFPFDTLETVTLGQLMDNMQVNAWAPFVLSRDFYRLAGKGKIINLIDTKVTGYVWEHLSYILSKQALLLLTRMTALHYAPKMTVNAIAPGLILPPPGKDASYLDSLTGQVPLKRHGDPADIAAAVLYLLQNDYITGQVLYLDGGWHLLGANHGSY